MAQLADEVNNVYPLILGEGITARDTNRERSKRKKEIEVSKSNIEKGVFRLLGG